MRQFVFRKIMNDLHVRTTNLILQVPHLFHAHFSRQPTYFYSSVPCTYSPSPSIFISIYLILLHYVFLLFFLQFSFTSFKFSFSRLYVLRDFILVLFFFPFRSFSFPPYRTRPIIFCYHNTSYILSNFSPSNIISTHFTLNQIQIRSTKHFFLINTLSITTAN